MKLRQIHFKVTPSTSTYGKENFSSLDRDGWTWITADSQTAGHGRWGRRWYSPPNVNLYGSLCFTLRETSPLLYLLPLFTASCCKELLEKEELKITIKPPNDLLHQDKKFGGILVESIPLGDGLRGVILGVGINVNMGLNDLLLVDQPATSLFQATGRLWEIAPFRQKVALHLISAIESVRDEKEASKILPASN